MKTGTILPSIFVFDINQYLSTELQRSFPTKALKTVDSNKLDMLTEVQLSEKAGGTFNWAHFAFMCR